MPYEGIGKRHTVDGVAKACKHGQIISEDGFIGTAFKITQIGRFVNPSSAAAQDIVVGEDCELQLGGIAEAPASGNLATAAVGSAIYIDTATNTLGLTAQAITTGNALNAGWLPVGKVTEIDASRNPDVLRINLEVAYLVRGVQA